MIHFIYIKVNASRSMDDCPKLATHSESGYIGTVYAALSIIGKVYGFDMIVIIYSVKLGLLYYDNTV